MNCHYLFYHISISVAILSSKFPRFHAKKKSCSARPALLNQNDSSDQSSWRRCSSSERGLKYFGAISNAVKAPAFPSFAKRPTARAYATKTLEVNSGLLSNFKENSIKKSYQQTPRDIFRCFSTVLAFAHDKLCSYLQECLISHSRVAFCH